MKLKCKMCGKSFSHLGSHIWHAHKIRAREYKTEFGLPYNTALISSEIKRKKQDAFELDRPKYIKNLLKAGNKYRWKKGHSGIRRISQQERITILARINKVNKTRKKEPCPVCKMIYKNVDSHLANNHKLLRIK